MERIALVSGSNANVKPVAEALERAGFAVTSVTESGVLADFAADLNPGTLDCYIQLSTEAPVDGPTSVHRAARFLATELCSRFETAATVVPLLRPDACVILVAGDAAPESTPDDVTARLDLLGVLCRSIAGISPGAEIKAVLVGPDRSEEELADMASRRGEDRQWLHSRIRSLDPSLNFADWRSEVLGLT